MENVPNRNFEAVHGGKKAVYGTGKRLKQSTDA